MKLKLLAGAALAALVTATGAVAAEGWYSGIDLGYNWKSNYTSASANAANDTGKYRFDISTKKDWAGFARLGYRYNDNWRLEFEGGYRPGDVNGGGSNFTGRVNSPIALCSLTQTTTVCGSPSGTMSQTSLFANLIYDLMPSSSFHPFVGVGAGMNQIKANYKGKTNNANQVVTVSGKDTVGAAQALAGMSWALSDRMNLDFTYRYVWNNEASFGSSIAGTAVNPSSLNPAPGQF